MTPTEKKTTSPLIQQINTALLTILCGVSMLIFSKVNAIEKNQTDVGKELVRLKTVQDNNTSKITVLDAELHDHIVWADLNYIRKDK